MKIPKGQHAIDEAISLLENLLGPPPQGAVVRDEPRDPRFDAVARIGDHTFLIEWKGSSSVSSVSSAIEQIQRHARHLYDAAIPVIAVPFMGPSGKARCEEAGIGWIDLSGNARILGPGLVLRVEGNKNRFVQPGRPSSVFAPKSSRIARWLLIHPHREMSQREIAAATDMGEGFTSRIVSRLADEHLIVRGPRGRVKVRDPDLLLDAWAEHYSFDRHEILKGHIPARSSDKLLTDLAAILEDRHVPYATTGLSAAWVLTQFAGFRTVTFYVGDALPENVLREANFRQDERGANTWLVVPNDDGVYQGASDRNGLRCVHPVQVYLDLAGHPERSAEAASDLRKQILDWNDR
jgi:hypothetical protein